MSILSLFLSLNIFIAHNSLNEIQEANYFAYAHVIMDNDYSVLSPIFAVQLEKSEDAVKQFRLDNTNKFIKFCQDNPEIDYSPKFKVEPGSIISLFANEDEAYKNYNEIKALSNDKFFVVEGFSPVSMQNSKKKLIRN